MVFGCKRGRVAILWKKIPFFKEIRIDMKSIKILLFTVGICLAATSCSVFKKGEGCPTNGKNVGAEKLLDGSKTPKAKKFKA